MRLVPLCRIGPRIKNMNLFTRIAVFVIVIGAAELAAIIAIILHFSK